MKPTYHKKLACGLLLALLIMPICTIAGQVRTDQLSSPFFSSVEEYPQRSLQHEVSGTVTDANAEPLPGVNIQVKGTTMGTSSDVEGGYELRAPSGSDTLLFSFVGFQTQEVPIEGRTQIDVQLQSETLAGDELVVIGYGTQRKQDLTGSVSRVGSEDFVKGGNASPDQLVQGKISGVNIVNNSGNPGGGVTFRIRGTSSVRTGNQPLFVVDGVPLDGRNTKPSATAGELGTTEEANPLNFINSNDIESIDVLKDASATAIYGARGANGVVIITTKKGQVGAPKFNIDMSTGVSYMANKPDVMGAEAFRQALQKRGMTEYNGGTSVDAFDAIPRLGITNIANISVSGGNENGNYRISGGYYDQEGVVKESGITKYTGNFSGTYNFFPEDRLKIDIGLIASNTIDRGAPIAENSNVNGSLIGNAIEWNPTVPFKRDNGEFVQRTYDEEGVSGLPTNPLALIYYYDDRSNVSNILGNISATFNLVEGLDYKFSLGANQSKGNREINTSGDLFLSTITDLGLAVVNSSTLTSSTLTNTLNYETNFSDNINLNALAGYEYQTYKSYTHDISAQGFTSFDVKGSNILQNPSNDNISINSYRDPTNEIQSYFTRINLNFSDKYLLTGTFRADGSTKFGENNKYGYFPSFAGAWVLSEEGFLSGSDQINYLKLRVGWGQTGNQEFPAGASRDRYTFDQQQISLINVANPDLKWETSETINVGVDFEILDSQLSGTVEYFDKSTEDLLFQLPALQPAPAAEYWTNLPAAVKNSGIEVSMNSRLISGKDLVWELGANASFLKNKLENYDGAPVLTGQINGNGLGGGSNSQRLVDGQPLYVFKMLRFEGFDESGVAQYSDEQHFVGNPNPDVLLGLNTSLQAGNFGVSMSFNGAFGHQLYNNTANAVITAANFALGRNTSEEIAMGNESLSNANVVSTRFLEDGDFVRMQNLVVSYDPGLVSGLFDNLRLSLTGQNLFVITNYSGFDPEINTDRSVDGVPSFGIEYIPYPPSRTFMLGVNVSF